MTHNVVDGFGFVPKTQMLQAGTETRQSDVSSLAASPMRSSSKSTSSHLSTKISSDFPRNLARMVGAVLGGFNLPLTEGYHV